MDPVLRTEKEAARGGVPAEAGAVQASVQARKRGFDPGVPGRGGQALGGSALQVLQGAVAGMAGVLQGYYSWLCRAPAIMVMPDSMK